MSSKYLECFCNRNTNSRVLGKYINGSKKSRQENRDRIGTVPLPGDGLGNS